MMFISVSSAAGALQDGKARLLAVLEPKRYAKMPDVPSMSEFLPAFRKPSTWFGFLGPPNMPRELVARLNAEMIKAITAPDARAKLEGSDLAVIAGTPERVRRSCSEGRHRKLRRDRQSRRHHAAVRRIADTNCRATPLKAATWP